MHYSLPLLCFKFKEEITNPFALVSLIDDYYGIAYELSLIVSNIKREVCGVFYSFLSFLKTIEEKIAHNMLSLMLDPRFKSSRLTFSFVG
jgi:hypothetical protein